MLQIKTGAMRHIEHKADICIVGGGLSGLCAAIAAAREGARVLLMQDRPVLGGNASSEIRMWVRGAAGKENRETGIISELEEENIYRNPSLVYSHWDSVLWGKARAEENIELLLNCSCVDADLSEDGKTILSVKGWQLNTETYHIVNAKYFADCSGDSILAPLTGAAYMYGREGKDEYGESIAPDKADSCTMGMSCIMQARETDGPKPFIKPEWAYTYETEDDLKFRKHIPIEANNYWWIELGGTGDGIHNCDEYRDEMLKIAYGVWDHIKNHGDHKADNWELEWIGMLPGKRESRRYVGRYIINENDVRNEGKFDDVVAYGGWTMDDHFPEGFYYKDGVSTIWHPAPSPWGIPFRALYARDIENLLFAGRNVSVTHVALSSIRVMATCALMGQAVGTAVAQMVSDGTTPDTIDIPKLQQTLMDDDCWLPGFTRARSAATLNSSLTHEVLRDGVERGADHAALLSMGESAEYRFDEPTKIYGVRLVFDSDLNRKYWHMPKNFIRNETRYKPAAVMTRDYDITLTLEDGSVETVKIRNNRSRFVKLPMEKTVTSVRFTPISTFGADRASVFTFELY